MGQRSRSSPVIQAHIYQCDEPLNERNYPTMIQVQSQGTCQRNSHTLPPSGALIFPGLARGEYYGSVCWGVRSDVQFFYTGSRGGMGCRILRRSGVNRSSSSGE